MGARTTLNSVYLMGALFVAAILGGATGSWVIFAVSLAIIVGVSLHAGRIRPGRRGRRAR
jgi:hypothetical protein